MSVAYHPRPRPWIVWLAWSTNGFGWTSGPSSKPRQRTSHFIWKKGSTEDLWKTKTTTGHWKCHLASSHLGVAGMVASMVTAGRAARLPICLSQCCMSAQVGARARCMVLSRGGYVDPARQRMGTASAIEAQGKSRFVSSQRLFTGSCKGADLGEGSSRTVAGASKRVAVIFAKFKSNTSRNRTPIKFRPSQIQTISGLSQARVSSLLHKDQKQKHPPPAPTVTTLQRTGWRTSLRSAQRRQEQRSYAHTVLPPGSASLTSW